MSNFANFKSSVPVCLSGADVIAVQNADREKWCGLFSNTFTTTSVNTPSFKLMRWCCSLKLWNWTQWTARKLLSKVGGAFESFPKSVYIHWRWWIYELLFFHPQKWGDAAVNNQVFPLLVETREDKPGIRGWRGWRDSLGVNMSGPARTGDRRQRKVTLLSYRS